MAKNIVKSWEAFNNWDARFEMFISQVKCLKKQNTYLNALIDNLS